MFSGFEMRKPRQEIKPKYVKWSFLHCFSGTVLFQQQHPPSGVTFFWGHSLAHLPLCFPLLSIFLHLNSFPKLLLGGLFLCLLLREDQSPLLLPERGEDTWSVTSDESCEQDFDILAYKSFPKFQRMELKFSAEGQ